MVVFILTFFISLFIQGYPTILLFMDGPLAEIFVSFENTVNCKDYCILFEIIIIALLNAVIVTTLLSLFTKKNAK